jgi:hypothetical protein
MPGTGQDLPEHPTTRVRDYQCDDRSVHAVSNMRQVSTSHQVMLCGNERLTKAPYNQLTSACSGSQGSNFLNMSA